MSHSPTTPDKASKHAIASSPKSAMPSTEKLTSTSNGKQAYLNEPSPASTYGDTAGSSAPATPHDPETRPLNLNQGFLGSLIDEQVDSAIKSISGSPLRDPERIYSAQSGRRADHVTLIAVYSSPSKSGSIANAARIASTNSSPGSDRAKAKLESPNWRIRDVAFGNRSGNPGDDVFISRDNSSKSPGQGNDLSFNPRGDRAREPISNDNAQALLSPNACVFVANLMQTQTDDQLEYHVQTSFSQYGTCYVKIRRDPNGMPFAFVQYLTAEDAQKAITEGRGMMINGRACRTEVAKVNRSVFLSRVTGGPISEAEARNILSRYGDIQRVWHSTPTENEMFRLPEGIWVQYAYFQDCRDAQAGFRDHPKYRLEQPPVADDSRARLRTRQYSSMSPMGSRQSPGRMMPSPMRRAATDRCSIFVGNLPATTTQEQLYHMFDMHGTIQNIEIVRKASPNVTGVNTFAFIEYLTPEGAITAIQANPRMYGNLRLRVEHKESVDPSVRQNNFMVSGGSPRDRYLADHDQMTAFKQGVYAGMNQAVQAQTLPPPMWSPYSYCAPYDPIPFGPFAAPGVPGDNNNNNNNTAAGLQSHANGYATHAMGLQSHANGYGTQAMGIQSHANGYATQAMGHFQYPQAPPAAAHYGYAQGYGQGPQQSAVPVYQWPLVNSSNDDANASPAASTQDAR